MADKIDGIYHKEFELDPKEIECINKMKTSSSLPEDNSTAKDEYTPPKADGLKKVMSSWKISSEIVTEN